MADRLKGLATMFKDSRVRTVLVITVLLLAVAIVFGFLKLHAPKGPASPGGSALAGAPQNIQSIPGGFGQPESAAYARLQEQQNIQEAQRAARTGASAIPTLVSSASLGNQGFAQPGAGAAAARGATAGPQGTGCVAPGTNLYSASCQVIGTLGPNGVIQSIGVSPENQTGRLVYGPSGNVIGRVGPNGEVFNPEGRLVGQVGPNGEVLNSSGQVIGNVAPAAAGSPVYGPDGKLIGTVEPNGQVVNSQGQVIGKMLPNGEVVNSQGQPIGKAANIAPGQVVYGPDGKVIGKVGTNGDVLNSEGQVIGHVLPNGQVVDAQGKVIGAATGFPPGQVVYGSDGKVIGKVGPNGEVLNAQGQVVGRVLPNGQVENAQGQVIGAVRAPGGLAAGTPIYDGYGNLVGTVGPDGRLVPTTRVAAAPAGAAQAGAARPAAGGPPAAPGLGGNAALQAIAERQAAQLSAAEAQQARQQLQGAMSGQAGQLISAWAPPSQQYVTGTQTGQSTAQGAGAGAVGGLGGQSPFSVGKGPVIKAGSIMFAVLDTSINTDEPGPILATITSGGLKGGKLIGTLTNQGKKVMVTFKTLSYEPFPTSIPIDAVAVDPETAHTGLSDYTNNHYLLKYGSLFAASFMQGYAQAISQSGSTIVSNGFNTQKNLPTLSPTGELVVALGNVGTQYTSVLSRFQNVPPTVHVYAGTALGVVILNDLHLPNEAKG